VDGVGANPSDCLPWLGPLVGWIQAVTGYQMKQIILNTWRGLINIADMPKPNCIVLIGCSRGGFACQVLTHILAQYGLPPTDQEKTKEIEKRIKDGSHDNDRQSTDLSITLYALDPVGTYGLTGQTPSRFFGFEMAKLPLGCPTSNVVIRARVALMYNECRALFRPNIYRSDPGSHHEDELQQVWFQGFHADAWGPSERAVAIAAYILADLEKAQSLQLDSARLKKIAKPPWPGCTRDKEAKAWIWNLTKKSSRWEEHQPSDTEWRHHTFPDNITELPSIGSLLKMEKELMFQTILVSAENADGN